MKSTALATFSAISMMLPALCIAAPVELDTADTHIIVVRPVDIWSGDRSAQSDSLDHVRSKTALYWVWTASQNVVNGGPLWLQRVSDHPIVTATTAALAKSGFELGLSQSYGFRVQQPQTLEPSRFEAFSTAQTALYKITVLSQGDPDTLSGRVAGRKFAGGVLSLVTLGVAGGVGGALGAETVLNTGIAGDVYQLPLALRGALAPALLPPFDASAFKQVEVRSVTYRGGMNGQILIAYRADKTEANEVEAMGLAIATAAGAGTSVPEVEKSRADDLAFRKATWEACVTAGDCKDGVYAPRAR